jgi:hypothetical protein
MGVTGRGHEEVAWNLPGVALISCRQTTSGASRSSRSVTCAERARRPFTFQVATLIVALAPRPW